MKFNSYFSIPEILMAIGCGNFIVDTYFGQILASCHYGKKAMEWYAANNVQVVPKDKNSLNTPELHPIEKYWVIIKRNFKKWTGRLYTIL